VRDLAVLFVHLVVTVARLAGPGPRLISSGSSSSSSSTTTSIARMQGGQDARRCPARTRPSLARVSARISGSRTVVGCITRRGPRDAIDPQRVDSAIYEFATDRRRIRA
jgi:hypothetical protein